VRTAVRGPYQYGVTARPRGSCSWLSALLTLFATGVVAAIALAINQFIQDLPSPSFGSGHAIPQLVGMPLASVQERAHQDGMSIVLLGERPSERYPRGTVIQQSPVPGWSTGDESILRITVSSGLAVPNVVGQTLTEARAKLTRLGWSVVAPAATSADARVKLQHPEPGLPVDAPGELALAFGDSSPSSGH
jgi:beta-lactam-binding protein with PASTA domain